MNAAARFGLPASSGHMSAVLPVRLALVLLALAVFCPIGGISGKTKTLTFDAVPGPGAVTMLWRPVEKSTKPELSSRRIGRRDRG